ncbi:porin family protein [Tenacibaculum agarivorans]|uniref:outer membrane beta-barrel protein n=1 Tax=Tenacibaculum agarivorans TaxID=1908389 RepID=UPI00094BC1A6|nr:outer membrane beta-barrel protein [Tenacibaculum agarivorans]
MKNNSEDIGLVFKDKLNTLHDSPDDFLWDSIERKLRKRKKRALVIKITIICLLVFMGLLASKSFQSSKSVGNHTESKPTPKKLISKDQESSTTVKPDDIDSNRNHYKHKNSTTDTNKQDDKKMQLTTKQTKLHQKGKLSKEHTIQKANSTQNISLVINENISSKDSIQMLTLQSKGYSGPKNVFSTLDLQNKEQQEHFKKGFSITLNGQISSLNFYSKGNALSQRLIDNKKTNNISFNYGVNVNYHINDYFLLRVGLHRLNLQYTTSGINISGSNSQLSSLSDIRSLTSSLFNQNIATLFNNDERINITEKISYLEIPMEFKYTFIRKKVNLSLIAGYSFLFLNDAQVFGESQNTTEFLIGNSSAYNAKNYSLNLGLGSTIPVYKKLDLILELNYKNYFTTYITNSNNLQPFTLNLNTGIRYKF